MPFFAGLDWGQEKHAVCIVDERGAVKAHFEVNSDEAGLTYLVKRFSRLALPSELPIAIERPSGLVVDHLVESGFVVVPIHPNILKATRPRYSSAGAKCDATDAYMLADVLRTDGHRFEPLRPQSDSTRALRTLVRTRDDLVEQRVALTNRLSSLLESYWPGALHLFWDIASPIALAFLKAFPSPEMAEELTERKLAAFLKKHAYSGGRSPEELLVRLQRYSVAGLGAAERKAKEACLASLVNLLQTVVTELKTLTDAVEKEVAEHPDGHLLMSLPRAGKVNAAQILAELGDDRQRFVSKAQLAAEAGVAPVTRASGKSHRVSFRFACNKPLRKALTCWADNSRHASSWAAGIYTRARERGCTHQHAVRILARAWAAVLWHCWQEKTPYSPSLHKATLACSTG